MLTSATIGIGRFSIVDNTVVSEADLGVNFFLNDDSIGKMRAQCSTELLLELNPEVQGDWYPKSEVCTDTASSLAGNRQIWLV
jgi:amyloid beta precursor protein binding protein 1